MFGHEKGSFTGATAQRIGRFEEADGGTIFLDEIAEMSPALQAKLLRVTQDGTFQRIGSNREIQHQRRASSPRATANLEEEVKAGRFREDLFYRLNVVELNIPPLRERREDILPLASRFIDGIRQGPRAIFRDDGFRLPGKLSVAGQRARVAQRDGAGGAAFPERTDSAGPSADARARRRGDPPPPEAAEMERLEEIERQAIMQTLRQHNFNRTETAKALGISRRALIYKLQRFRELGYKVE